MGTMTEITAESLAPTAIKTTSYFADASLDFAISLPSQTKEDYVSKFSALAVKTAKSTLEMCRVVYEAKKNLEPSDFADFCIDIGRKEEDSTIRKHLAIGEAYPRFIAHADKLPNAWTSIYQITLIPSDKFAELIESKTDLKDMTGSALQKLIAGEPTATSPSEKSAPSALIYFKKEPTVPQWNYFRVVLNKLISECADLDLYTETTPRYKNLIKDLKKENRENAKRQNRLKIETQKAIDERNICYRPDLFNYGEVFDKEKGDFV